MAWVESDLSGKTITDKKDGVAIRVVLGDGRPPVIADAHVKDAVVDEIVRLGRKPIGKIIGVDGDDPLMKQPHNVVPIR